ncbi:MAG: double-strand break repair protein AddB [Robiginitomaculum sp.]|nr:MAG: double-strand break repair protein AddB [Robiginitomaculum sp.]
MAVAEKTLFDADTPNVYTMPAGAPFLKHLAQGLKASLGKELSNAMILLPTRRAVRELTDAFLDTDMGGAVLLPRLRTLADMDENEPPFAPGPIDINVPPAIDGVRHRFELAQLVVRKLQVVSGEDVEPDAASALAMTEPLVTLLSDLSMEELGPQALRALDEDMESLPAHFQNAAEFVKIIAEYWPEHLAALGLSEPSARRVALLNAAAKLWDETPPDHPVIVAGSTGTLAATARLIKAVSKMPKGLVVLPGLDVHIDEQVWNDIDEDIQHPQASLKNLIKTLGVERADVAIWPGLRLSSKAKMRARILSQSLIPANSTSDWPKRIAWLQQGDSAEDTLENGLDGLSLIEAKTEEEEAGLIALILRETLETPEKTAALITPDPALARRVRAKLSRWGVEVDSSAGEPLEETLHGSFLALSAEVALDPFDPVALSGLVRHRLFALENKALSAWEDLEKRGLRGPRPKTLVALEARLDGKCAEGLALFKSVQATLAPLSALCGERAEAGVFARTHTAVLEQIAGGANKIWRTEAGEKAATLMEELMAYGKLLPEVDGPAYGRLLSMMMRGRVVRPRYGTEVRLHILGPLEARMIDADRIVLGGLNEGVWPAPPAPHPVLSRGMRLKIGLTAPERRFGLAAHDFAQLAAKQDVILTRSQRTGEGPGVQSRWLWRLTTLVKGAQKEHALKTGQHYLDWVRALDVAPEHPSSAPRPQPRPKLEARWPNRRRLSVTQISTWVRDPYAIYAKHVLGLRSLDPPDQPLGAREYGIAVHKALETIDNISAPKLAETLKMELRRAGYEEPAFARLNVRLEEMAEWLVGWARHRRADGWRPFAVETKGEFEIFGAGAPFVLSGIPDRIEKCGDEISILDFKTGTLPTEAMVRAGFDPQLPLLSVMLSEGCFGASGQATELRYIKPNARGMKARDKQIKSRDYGAQDYAQEALEALRNLIAYFDREDTAYYSQPRAQYVNRFGDYDHLARRAEWATLQDNGGGNDG